MPTVWLTWLRSAPVRAPPPETLMVLLWLLVIVCIVAVLQGRDRMRRLEETIAELRASIDRLSRRIGDAGAPASRAPSRADAVYTRAPSVLQVPLLPPEVQLPPPDVPPPPVPPRPAAPRSPAPEPAAPRPSFDWEGLIGVKLFSWVAGVALALAGIFFLRYSVENG